MIDPGGGQGIDMVAGPCPPASSDSKDHRDSAIRRSFVFRPVLAQQADQLGDTVLRDRIFLRWVLPSAAGGISDAEPLAGARRHICGWVPDPIDRWRHRRVVPQHDHPGFDWRLTDDRRRCIVRKLHELATVAADTVSWPRLV